MKKSMNVNFKSHLGLFNYNFFSNISTKLWVWIFLQLVFVTVFFFGFNYVANYNFYFKTRLAWMVIGTTLFVNYIFFLFLNLLNIFKNDVDNGMNVVFLSKPFSRLTLYLNKIVSLFALCFCYNFIFFIYASILSAFVDSPYRLMIININGYLLLTELTIFFLIVGFTLWVKLSQKGLLIFFSLMLFLVFPLTTIVASGMVGPNYALINPNIKDFNSLSGKELNMFEQSKYFVKKYGKEKLKMLTTDWEEFFQDTFKDNEGWEVVNKYKDKTKFKRDWKIEIQDFDQVRNIREKNIIPSLFTKWDVSGDKPKIIEAHSVQL